MLVQELLKSCAQKYGDRVYASAGDENMTYRELDYYSDRLALELKKYGRGTAVGILSKNSLDYLVCHFGIIKSGNIVVAINPLNKEYDLERIISNAGIRVLFTNNNYLQTVLNLDKKLLDSITCYNFDDEFERYKNGTSMEIKSFKKVILDDSDMHYNPADFYRQDENDIAQIIYTSGTKGLPNGVCLTHRNLLANMEQIIDRIDINENDNMLVIIPFYYSYGNSLILSHVARGARLTINNNSQLPVYILNDLKEKKCTSIAGVASNFILLLKRSPFKELEWPALRYVTFAGEPVADWVVSEMRSMGLDVYVMYGQTEATARISILKPDELDKKPGSVGRPIKGMDLKIVDSEGNILPPNEYGEVIVAGPNIMKCYWNDPEATASKIKDSYLYTGDFGKLDEDGYLYISGRMDEMIKIGGERVFPIEIEKALLTHELVAEAGVIGIKEESGIRETFSDYMGKTIYAFVVPKERLTENEIYEFCKRVLPRHKVPARVVFVEALPRTNTGKLKRDLLAELLK
ncbi:MAG: class I adenylate-forming enzyme family protein [Peptococcaceae bacterium]|nr:acyl--CoA ligase [Peptococcaceae bacterium]MDH7525025.1 class I adenylate-forming enzyme family protein [Peptococcaceae bacterium]